jgi:hypothetical protein
VLRGDTATAERLGGQANLNEDTRRSIQQQARRSVPACSSARPPPASTPRLRAPPAMQPRARRTRLAAEPRRDSRDERDPQRLPPSMLERFSTSDHPTGSTP